MSKPVNTLPIDFLGIGAPKSATSWLARCLREHPEICMPTADELYFFNEKYPRWITNPTDRYEERGLAWYRKQFSHCTNDTVRGEFCTRYLNDPKALSRIAHHAPQVKLIICLRNPADRTYSEYLHGTMAATRTAPLPDFSTLIRDDMNFVSNSFYDEQLENVFARFPKKQVLVTFYEDIQKNPLAYVQRVYKFLGITSNFIPPSLEKKRNVTGPQTDPMNRSLRVIKNWLTHSSLGRRTKDVLKPTGIPTLGYRFILYPLERWRSRRTAERQYTSMTPEDREYLNSIFKKHNQRLSKILGESIPF